MLRVTRRTRDWSHIRKYDSAFWMIIPEINLQITIASRVGAESLLTSEPQRWCVISIRGPRELRARLSKAKHSVEIILDDVADADAIFAPHPVHAQAMQASALATGCNARPLFAPASETQPWLNILSHFYFNLG